MPRGTCWEDNDRMVSNHKPRGNEWSILAWTPVKQDGLQ